MSVVKTFVESPLRMSHAVIEPQLRDTVAALSAHVLRCGNGRQVTVRRLASIRHAHDCALRMTCGNA